MESYNTIVAKMKIIYELCEYTEQVITNGVYNFLTFFHKNLGIKLDTVKKHEDQCVILENIFFKSDFIKELLCYERSQYKLQYPQRDLTNVEIFLLKQYERIMEEEKNKIRNAS